MYRILEMFNSEVMGGVCPRYNVFYVFRLVCGRNDVKEAPDENDENDSIYVIRLSLSHPAIHRCFRFSHGTYIVTVPMHFMRREFKN